MYAFVIFITLFLIPGTIDRLGQEAQYADVLSVAVSGSEGGYTFKVRIKSPDKGCDQYADWWEVIDSQGKLLYRRILQHSHVREQPFERPGGPIRISARREIYIRAHMNNAGYGGAAFGGSISQGLESMDIKADFASDLENISPLPEGCAF